MGKSQQFLENSLIVGAHPDDELLWFGSILKDVDEVVIAFCDFWAQPGLGEARNAALSAHPHPNVNCLGINEAGTYGCADWNNPRLNEIGIEFTSTALLREIKRRAKAVVDTFTPVNLNYAPQSIAEAYRQNYQNLREALRPRMRADMNVFTHNPWGEYGHEDHIQVFRVLEHLRDEIGFTLWMSNYCTERVLPLASRHFVNAPEDYVRLPVDTDYAEAVANVYRDAGCWTWADDWAWFAEECFMKVEHSACEPEPHQHLFPLNLFTIEAAASKPRAFSFM